MFVLVAMAVTVTVTNGACPEPDSSGAVQCDDRNLATIPQLPVSANEV